MSSGVRWTNDDLRQWHEREKRRKVSQKPLLEHNSPATHQKSHLEERFLRIWGDVSHFRLEREHRFDPNRKWRADFACPEAMVLIEIEGGVWSQGRHNRGLGMINDAEKYFAATVEHGWTVIRLVEPMVNFKYIEKLAIFVSACAVEAAKARADAPKPNEPHVRD